MINTHEEAEKALQLLFIEYAYKLPNKIALLNGQWQALKQNKDSAIYENLLSEFHRELHNLYGSLSTYGYRSFSQTAKRIEIYLQVLLGKNQPLSNKDIQYIENLLNEFVIISPSTINENVVKTTNTLWVLDKDSLFQQTLAKKLQHLPINLLHFENLQSIEITTSQNIPAIILIDYEILITGKVKLLMKTHDTLAIKFICLSNQDDFLTRLNAIRHGCDAFIHKQRELPFLTQFLSNLYIQKPNENYKVLIIDDAVSLAEYYKVILQNAGMKASVLNHCQSLLNEIENFKPDVILMDIHMPEYNGFELATIVKQHSEYYRIPILFISKEDDRFKQISAFHNGGDCFLSKPILPEHLIATIKLCVKKARPISSHNKNG